MLLVSTSMSWDLVFFNVKNNANNKNSYFPEIPFIFSLTLVAIENKIKTCSTLRAERSRIAGKWLHRHQAVQL